jgi:hypothetical protein
MQKVHRLVQGRWYTIPKDFISRIFWWRPRRSSCQLTYSASRSLFICPILSHTIHRQMLTRSWNEKLLWKQPLSVFKETSRLGTTYFNCLPYPSKINWRLVLLGTIRWPSSWCYFFLWPRSQRSHGYHGSLPCCWRDWIPIGASRRMDWSFASP